MPEDRFGGVATQIDETARLFRTRKLGNRWYLITPDGNPFWMRGVYAVNLSGSIDDSGVSNTAVVTEKYGDASLTWGPQQNRRLRCWGFNATAEYSSGYVQPTWTNPAWPGGKHPEPMPFTALISPSYYSLTNRWNHANGPVKELVRATKSTVYNGWRGHSPDIWDPNFKMWLAGAVQRNWDVPAWLTGPNNDYLIGIQVDDVDWLQGFGAGLDFVTVLGGGYLNWGWNPHLSWIILVGPPTQTSNAELGVTYTDTTVYSKRELSNFLATRYGSVSALNTAWGSSYTTFGSSGGWGTGTGLLDEDGTHTWVPKDFRLLTGATAAMKQDLDDFLFVHAQKYFSDIKSVLDTYAPGRLYLGPTTIGSWGAPPRRQILQAASQYVDVYGLYDMPSGVPDDQARLDFLAQYGGDKPWFSWTAMEANPDSSLYAYTAPYVVLPRSQTQEERGQVYARKMDLLIDARTSSGTYPVVGLKFWGWVDSWGEKGNWGLVSRRDNAYDGYEARTQRGTDAWGYPTGGEVRDYGDFISAVKAANLRAQRALQAEVGRGAR